MTDGYVHDAAFDSGLLEVDSIHRIHYQQYGRRDGKAVIFLHGGPGGATSASNTIFFDPNVYRVVLFDQRGCGQSQPRNEIRNNTTWHLVDDIERLRTHLNIEQWHMVFGGSWGSALALCYAETFPTRVRSLVLRGVFTARKLELLHSRRGRAGAAAFYPDEYDAFVGSLSEDERSDPIAAYYQRLQSDDPDVAAAAAKAWNRWDTTLVTLQKGPKAYAKLEDAEWCRTHALMESHYFHHGAWLEDGQLLANAHKIAHIPGAIVQGRYDLITPPRTAWDLHQAWPASKVHWLDDAGHSANEPSIRAKLIEVCDELAGL